MNVDEVRRRVAEIEAVSGDDEVAHASEDGLHQDVLAAIAAGAEDASALAAEALRTQQIEFARWCA